MATISWTSTNGGSVTADSSREGASRLASSDSGTYNEFVASATPDIADFSLDVHAPNRSDYFGIYLEVTTSAGRRQFKFEPNNSETRFRFGFRYSVGLDSDIRGGEWTTVSPDLNSIVTTLEPGAALQSIDRFFIRCRGVLSVAAGSTDTGGGVGGGNGSDDITRADAVRFLNQATFGASEATIAELQEIGSYEGWIDRQLALPMTSAYDALVPFANSSNSTYRHRVWWDHAMTAPDQLRQRMAFAYSQFFVVSDNDYTLSNSQWAVAHYYDMLGRGSTGNYRDLLEQVTLHPVMGIYLSMMRNEKADEARRVRPDENFAREVLQLFSIGLHELNNDGTQRLSSGQPIPTYDQTVVENFARVFTGWNFANQTWTDNNIARQSKETPMVPHEEYHDRGAKSLLGNVQIPGGQDARTDLEAALDNIAGHRNVGPFVARFLIQRFVTSNPSPAYVDRVATTFNNNGSGVRGDLGAVIKRVLLDDEARNGHVTMASRFGKFKEPLLRLFQLWRAFDAVPGPSAAPDYFRFYSKPPSQTRSITGQAPLSSPSVFNFYLPNNPLASGSDLVAPEQQILTEVNIASTNDTIFSAVHDFHNYRTNSNAGDVTRINVDRALALVGDPAGLVDYVDLMVNAGTTPTAVKAELATQVASFPDTEEGRLAATLDAIYCIAGSPFALVQR